MELERGKNALRPNNQKILLLFQKIIVLLQKEKKGWHETESRIHPNDFQTRR